MGVTGLWKLIEESGKPVPVETLENKVLAIDISIWLHQVVKGFQDNKGGNLPNAHLLGLFHRLCKLLYYRVKPVFIFDGGVPQLKRETIAKRSQNRNKLNNEADRIQELILQNLVRDQVVQKALGQDVCEALVSPSKQKVNEKPSKDDMFKLPCLKVENHIDRDDTNSSYSSYADTSETDSSYDEKTLRSTYHINLQAVDVTSDHFKNLPADVRHEILTDIKDMRKQSSWARLHELPAGAYDFSGFQMKRLLKRRQVQVSLEEAEQQMEGKCLTMTELETLMSEEGILHASELNAAQRIASDENTRFLLVKDLGKAYEKAQKEAKKELKKEMVECKKEEQDEIGPDAELGPDSEIELQKAIAMSFETTQVYKDDDYNENAGAKLNDAQRQELKMAANSLARAYMVEYAGMNDEEIQEMIRDKESLSQSEELQSSFNFQHNDRFVLKGEICTPYKDMPFIKEKLTTEQLTKKSLTMNDDDVQFISSSSDDSDLEEVVESENVSKTSFEIIVDPTKTDNIENDDLFSDIFHGDEMKIGGSNATSSLPISENLKNGDISTELSTESVVEGIDLAKLTSKIIQENEIDCSSASPDVDKTQNLETTDVEDQMKTANIPVTPISSNEICELNNTDVVVVQDKNDSMPNCKSPLPNINSAENILSPDINCYKTKEILNKLKEEIGKVQCITLDAIDTSNGSPVKNTTVAQNHPEEISDKTTLNALIVRNILTEDGENKHVNDDKVLEKNDSQIQKPTNLVNNTPKKDNINVPKAIINSQSNTSILGCVQIKTEKDDVEKSSIDLSTIKINTTPIKSPSKLDEILDYVKQQTVEAVNISLDDITPVKNDSFVIDDSDDSDVEIISATKQKAPAQSETKKISDVIEIFDDQSNELKTPVKAEQNPSNIKISDSVLGAKMILNVEESPELLVNNSSEVKKTPLSTSTSTSGEGTSKRAKVVKQLFEEEKEVVNQENEVKTVDPATTAQNIIEEAAKALREDKTQSELENIAFDIRKENEDLELERNRQNRMATSITEKMAAECKQLLRLFGVPYIVAPMEAEAQCAFLDFINLTDGTITDDSDVWLFGGRTVYKNFFNQKKNVLEFKIENIEKLFNMDRHKLIQLAMLVGSDYTTGINGIGAVTAIEILANFPITPMKEGEVTENMSILSSLRKFRDWWQTCKITKGGERSALRSKLRNVELFEGFPNMNIVEAYLRPTVNDSREKFAWGVPDVETIREFAKKKFGWTRSKTDEILQPVMKKLTERKTQMSIKNYFAVKSVSSVRELKVSKRVMTAIDKMSGDYVEPPPPNKKKERKPRKKKAPAQEPIECDLTAEGGPSNEIIDADVDSAAPKPKQRRTRQAKNEQHNEDDSEVFVTPAIPKKKIATRKRGAKVIEEQAEHVGDIASIEKVKPPKLAGVIPAKKKVPILPNPNQPIPQREKDKKEMELKKEKAIEIFKQKKAKENK